MFGTDAPPPARRYLVSITGTEDGTLHHVDEMVLTTGLTHGSGRLVAICGRFITAAPLSAPPGNTCSLCSAALVLTDG